MGGVMGRWYATLKELLHGALMTDESHARGGVEERPMTVGSWLAALSARTRLLLSAILVVVLIAIPFLAHQIATYGALVPSIAGEWYGPFYSAADGKHYVNTYNLYVSFSSGSDGQLTATTSSCTPPAGASYTQPPQPGLTFTGKLSDSRFTMSGPGGDIESDLAWAGSYSTDKIHVDFYVNGIPRTGSPYADLKRGSHDDFLRSCRVH